MRLHEICYIFSDAQSRNSLHSEEKVSMPMHVFCSFNECPFVESTEDIPQRSRNDDESAANPHDVVLWPQQTVLRTYYSYVERSTTLSLK